MKTLNMIRRGLNPLVCYVEWFKMISLSATERRS